MLSLASQSVLASESQLQIKPQSFAYMGLAFDTERNQKAYAEERIETVSVGKLIASRTKFISLEGKLFADLNLNFSRFPFKPDYNFKDLRNGYVEGAKADLNSIHVYFQDSSRAPRKEKVLKVPEPCVINGGVGEFVKANWVSLVAGKKIPFNMIVPARLDFYKFVAYEEKKYQVPASETGNLLCRPIVIEPKNSLLAMMLPTIVMHYEPKTLRMIRYQGIVNIADMTGRSLRVRVDYPQ
jgi:hypothetical protein